MHVQNLQQKGRYISIKIVLTRVAARAVKRVATRVAKNRIKSVSGLKQKAASNKKVFFCYLLLNLDNAITHTLDI
jgi:hypothetical protein